MKSTMRATTVVAASILLALINPVAAAAEASVPLPDNTVLTGSHSERYTFRTTTGYWSVVASDSATWIQNRDEAVGSGNWQIVDGCTLYTAKVSGWHGLLIVGDWTPSNASPGGGSGYALHRYNPGKPTTCPVKNFPGPTPAS